MSNPVPNKYHYDEENNLLNCRLCDFGGWVLQPELNISAFTAAGLATRVERGTQVLEVVATVHYMLQQFVSEWFATNPRTL